MKYAFFPGCSLESTAWDFDRSTRAVCHALDIELVDIPGWACCGSTPAHATNDALSVALPVLNLQKAKAVKAPVMTACASCYARLRTANYRVRNDAAERARSKRITGKPYNGRVEVHHVLDVLVNHLGVARSSRGSSDRSSACAWPATTAVFSVVRPRSSLSTTRITLPRWSACSRLPAPSRCGGRSRPNAAEPVSR